MFCGLVKCVGLALVQSTALVWLELQHTYIVLSDVHNCCVCCEVAVTNGALRVFLIGCPDGAKKNLKMAHQNHGTCNHTTD